MVHLEGANLAFPEQFGPEVTSAHTFVNWLDARRVAHPLEQLSGDARIAEQVHRVTTYVQFAKLNSSYWGEQLAGHTVTSVDDIQALPTTTKADIYEHHTRHLEEQLAQGTPLSQIKTPMMTTTFAGTELWKTSGSTGMATVLARLPSEQSSNAKVAGMALSHVLGKSDFVANLMHPGGGWSGFIYVREMLNAAGIATEAIGSAESKDFIADELKRWNFNGVFASPSSFASFLSWAEEEGVADTLPAIGKFIFIGEPASANVYTPAGPEKLLAYMEKRWGTQAFSMYSGTEIGIVGFPMCEATAQAKQLHAIDEAGFLEILDEKGLPVSQGESGQLVVTRLGNVAVPLMRFQSGDEVTLVQDNCECGQGRIIRPEGRLDDTIMLGVVKLFGGQKVIDQLQADFNMDIQLVVTDDPKKPGSQMIIVRSGGKLLPNQKEALLTSARSLIAAIEPSQEVAELMDATTIAHKVGILTGRTRKARSIVHIRKE